MKTAAKTRDSSYSPDWRFRPKQTVTAKPFIKKTAGTQTPTDSPHRNKKTAEGSAGYSQEKWCG